MVVAKEKHLGVEAPYLVAAALALAALALVRRADR